MQFIKAGECAESNIFNQLDQKKQALLRGGKDVINLSIGTPDFQPDEHVMRAVSEACLDPMNYRYSLTETPALLQAVQNWYRRRYDVALENDEIMAVCGSQEGIAHVGFAFAGEDGLILAPDPGYPIFSFGPMMTGATIGLYPLREENGWVLDFADIPDDVADRAKAMVVSYPNNPTTAVADRAFYEKLIAFAKKHEVIIIHDNAYSDLLLNGQTGISFLSVPGAKEVGIEFNSLSKTYNLTGMRVSFALGNAEVLRAFRAFRSQIDYGMFYPVQAGAVAALTGPQDIVRRNREGYMARRDALCGGLRAIGWDVADAAGTMFVWAKIPPHFSSSVAFVMELMEKTGVICVPGDSFGARGKGYVRFALVVPPERMSEAVRRIAESKILLK
ncbi:aminotransferase class I/II-fold pyridoxal phosphate-dependent enzyme [Agathobaculum sp. NTUH-O15-33]|uniref:aminotransferase class I/II-fold pyridoxal phosphate-dependent enzyme n=1 Tax=Agathobaculum sp. NTUH-O15-33 TaxID=3079302 RepID=UPI002958D954|nr:aminotransferase class I/II-fold pyridoxal phosphate-dependent enzyme [Agathobaculum sp. NTUH-O15-33]WNX83610.1 aminotransferase class I/II-fold pyridoxal phosphate-dependent enzyme [Agathobaculum sp. NTUH-O15-33]